MFDIIGDIHGHADELIVLLKKLGYGLENNSFQHPERKVLFVGDYIDRGPQIKETLEIVKAMVDSGNAIALMGNHEYNAICFHTPNKSGGHLRPHTIKNIVQHYETLMQFKNDQEGYNDYINWFKTLPLFYENENLRAVHACWINDHIEYLKNRLPNGRLTDDLIVESCNEETTLFKVIDDTLKGIELKLPDGLTLKDKDGFPRDLLRAKWWIDPEQSNYYDISFHPNENLPRKPISLSRESKFNYYKPHEKPVFFGHYWLKDTPSIQQNNICCLDYSVAKQGKLVAYRFNYENKLQNSNLYFK